MKVANSYRNYSFNETKAYEKNGKMYVAATCKCDRCVNGVFVCRVENGQPVPHPNAGGVCFACNGTGIIKKEIRLYTDKEYDQMERAKVKAADKRNAEREAKMKAEFATKRAQWLEREGFNEDEVTYVYFPANSYSVKEQLKEAGFRFNNTLMWHAAQVPEGYEDKVVRIGLDEVVEFSAWGEGHYKIGSKDLVAAASKQQREPINSSWFMQPKDKFENLKVTLTDIHTFSGAYGPTSIVRFVTENDEILKWYTTTFVDYEPGTAVVIKGTVKEHINDKYEDDACVTLITRCRISNIEGE